MEIVDDGTKEAINLHIIHAVNNIFISRRYNENLNKELMAIIDDLQNSLIKLENLDIKGEEIEIKA